MATEHEILRMLVRLRGDSSDFEKTVDKAVSAAVKGAQRIQDVTKKASFSSGMEKEAERIIQRNLTPTERYHQAVARLNQVFKETDIHVDQVNREFTRLTKVFEKEQSQIDGTAEALKQLNKERKEAERIAKRMEAIKLKEAQAAERAQAKREAEAQKITQRNMTPTETNEDALHKLSGLYLSTSMSTETYNREVARLNATLAKQQAQLDGTAAAQDRLNQMMKRAEQLTEKHLRPHHRYVRSIDELDELLKMGAISQHTYNQELNLQGEILRKARNPQYNTLIREAADLTNKHQDANVKFSISQNRLNDMLRKGYIDARTYGAELKQLKQRLYEAGAQTDKIGTSLVFTGLNMTATFGGMFYGVSRLIQSMGGLAAEFEATEIAFNAMIGDVQMAQQTLSALEDFALETPFTLDEVLAAGRVMVTFGEQGQQLMDTLEFIGNAAAGTNSRFSEIALVFNQIRGVGKLVTQDFNQLSTRGILSLQDLADYMGITVVEVVKMREEGKISFDIVRGTLKMLSEEGGRFHNILSKILESLKGQIDVLTGSLQRLGRSIFTEVSPAITEWVKWLNEMVMWLNQGSPALKRLVANALLVTAGILGLGLVVGIVITMLGQFLFALESVTFAMATKGVTIVGLTNTMWGYVASIKAAIASLITLKTLGIAAVAFAAYWYLIRPAFKDAADGIKEFKESAIKDLEELQNRQTKTLSGIENIANIPDRRAAYDKELELQKRNLATRKALLKEAEKEVERSSNTMLRQLEEFSAQWNPFDILGGLGLPGVQDMLDMAGMNSGLDLALAEQAALQKEVQTTEQFINSLKESMAPLKGREALDGIITSAIELQRELQKESATLGMDATEKKIYELKTAINEAELSSEDLAEAMRVIAQTELEASFTAQDRAAHELSESYKELNKSLNERLSLLRHEAIVGKLSSDELALRELKLKNLDPALIKNTQLILDQVKAQEKANQAAIDSKKANEQAAKSLLDSIKTPMEKYQEQVAEIRKLHQGGFFGDPNDPNTRNKVQMMLQKAQDELNKSNLNVNVNVNFSTNNALRRGSSAYNQLLTNLRLGAFNPNSFTGGQQGVPPVPPGGRPPGGGGVPPRGGPPQAPRTPANQDTIRQKQLATIIKKLDDLIVVAEAIEDKEPVVISEAGFTGP